MEAPLERASDQLTYWEKIATTKWGNYITEIERETILKAHHLAENPNVALELGCEGGRWSKLLSDKGWRMICTDINPKTLSVCKNKVPTATTILVDPDDSRIPSDSETIGLLLCIEVFEVMPCEWFVDETFRVLLNKALVVGIFLNRLSFRGIYRHFNARLHRSYDFYRLSYPAWRRKMSSRGFRFLYEQGMCWFPFHRDSNSFLVPAFTRIERSLGLPRLVSVSPWIAFIAQKNI